MMLVTEIRAGSRLLKKWSMLGVCLVYRVMDACGKLGEHKKSVLVARGEAECFSHFSSALPTFHVHS